MDKYLSKMVVRMRYLIAAWISLCLFVAPNVPALAKSSGASHHSSRSYSSGKSSNAKVIVKKCKSEACVKKHSNGTVIIPKKPK
jgi:hypothetical protein